MQIYYHVVLSLKVKLYYDSPFIMGNRFKYFLDFIASNNSKEILSQIPRHTHMLFTLPIRILGKWNEITVQVFNLLQIAIQI